MKSTTTDNIGPEGQNSKDTPPKKTENSGNDRQTWKQSILSKFPGVMSANSGKENYAPCLVHDDSGTSLKITFTENKAEIQCQAGCIKNHILNAVGLHKADLIFSPNGHKPKTPKQLFTEYWQKRRIQKPVSAKVTQEIVTYYTHTSRGEEKFQYSYLSQEAIPNGRDVKPFQRLNHKGSIKQYLYIPDTWEIYKKQSDVYVVEGIPDTLTLREIGVNCVGIRSKGGAVSALSELTALVDYAEIRKVIVMPDIDAWNDWCHGFKSSEAFKDGNKSKLYFVHFDRVRKSVNFPEKKDVNDVWGVLQDERKLRSAIIQHTTHEYDVKGEYDIDAINEAISHSEIKDYLCNHFNTTAGKEGSGENQEWRIKDQGGLFVNKKKQISRPDEGKGAGTYGIIGAITLAKLGKWKESDPQKFINVLCEAADMANIKPAYRIETTTKDPYILNSNNGKGTTEQRQDPEQAPHEQTAASNGYHLTDLGNAKRLVSLHGENIRFCAEHDKWYIWDKNKNIWEKDKGKNICVFQHAIDVVKTLYTEAGEQDNKDDRDKFSKWAHRTESRKNLSDMVYLAARQPDIAIEQERFDNHPFLLDCQDCMVDLETGDRIPHKREYYSTRRIPIHYNPSATCPEFEKFLKKIMADENGAPKTDLINFIQRAMGYTLTGVNSEDCLFFLHGRGKNGKTTFINMLSYMLGTYRQHLKIESLLLNKYDGIPNDLATLPGARLLTTTEIPEGRRVNESAIKTLTGGDEQPARFLHAEWFKFYPVFKLWMFGNHKPRITGTDDGIWRRIRLIPFAVQIPEDEQVDRHTLLTTLKKESEGILKWMIDGCLDWQKDGLQEPPEVLNATQKYREEMDDLADFFDEYCDIDHEYSVTTKNLYTAYRKWCDETACKPEGKIKFNRRVEERFNGDVWKDRGTDNKPLWYGIRVMPQIVQNEESGREQYDDIPF